MCWLFGVVDSIPTKTRGTSFFKNSWKVSLVQRRLFAWIWSILPTWNDMVLDWKNFLHSIDYDWQFCSIDHRFLSTQRLVYENAFKLQCQINRCGKLMGKLVLGTCFLNSPMSTTWIDDMCLLSFLKPLETFLPNMGKWHSVKYQPLNRDVNQILIYAL